MPAQSISIDPPLPPLSPPPPPPFLISPPPPVSGPSTRFNSRFGNFLGTHHQQGRRNRCEETQTQPSTANRFWMDVLSQQRKSVLLNATLNEQSQTSIPLFEANPPLVASLIEQQQKQQGQLLAAAFEYQKQQQMAVQATILQQQPVQHQQQHQFIPSWMPNRNMMPGTLPGPANSNKRQSTDPQGRGKVCYII